MKAEASYHNPNRAIHSHLELSWIPTVPLCLEPLRVWAVSRVGEDADKGAFPRCVWALFTGHSACAWLVLLHHHCIPSFLMDFINDCLALVPVPGIAAALSILRYIVSSVQQVQASKLQLTALATAIAQLVRTLNIEYTTGRLSPDVFVEPLDDLHRWAAWDFSTGLLHAI